MTHVRHALMHAELSACALVSVGAWLIGVLGHRGESKESAENVTHSRVSFRSFSFFIFETRSRRKAVSE